MLSVHVLQSAAEQQRQRATETRTTPLEKVPESGPFQVTISSGPRTAASANAGPQLTTLGVDLESVLPSFQDTLYSLKYSNQQLASLGLKMDEECFAATVDTHGGAPVAAGGPSTRQYHQFMDHSTTLLPIKYQDLLLSILQYTMDIPSTTTHGTPCTGTADVSYYKYDLTLRPIN